MIRKPVTIRISNGLEVRPIAMLVQVASQFDSEVYIENGTKKVNAKSIMGMMTLGLDVGDEVVICTNGSDEELAMKKVEDYLTNK